MRSVFLVFASACVLVGQQPPAYTIPTVDIADERHRQVIVDREPGQYLGHPTTLLLPDERTMLVTYPKGHGKGEIVLKRSLDGGLTWSDRLPTPENWSTSRETPTLYRLIDPKGKARILLFSGKGGLIRIAYSEDEGETWSPLQDIRTPGRPFGGIVAMSSVVELRDGRYMALFHDDGRWLRDPAEFPAGKRFHVYKTVTEDGGLTWTQPESIAHRDDVHLCEPGALRSPDGKRIAVLLRENSRTRNSFVVFSDDEGETWSSPKELPAALTGDRHVARYAPDGRLLITFRDTTRESPTKGDWVAWVGTWEDIVEGREGQYRVRLMDNTKGGDTAYPGLELLPDGTFVATTYGHWDEGEEPYIVSVRYQLQELDRRARTAAHAPTALVAKRGFEAPAADGPNILFVSFDDLNDWALGEDSPLHMPHLRRLMRRGVTFTHAYAPSPACNPSRSALLLGRATAATGIYSNASDWRKAFPDAVTLPRWFLENGYRVEGAGKVFHHHQNSAYHDDQAFHRFQKMQLDLMPVRKWNGLEQVSSENFDWAPWPLDPRQTPDQRSVDFGVEFLRRDHDRPFFLAVGLFRPHMPFHVPPKYFALYPSDDVVMPLRPAGDLDDVPAGGRKLLERGRLWWNGILKADAESPGAWREAVRSYQASATFADHQLGRLLTALASSRYAENTVIVVWSDHGYHLGEKEHWEKFALWEKTTRVPLVFAGPGVAKGKAEAPVSLLDLYPTLIDLAGIPERTGLDGRSLVPLLRDPAAAWSHPAVMTYGPGNHAVRTARWRYIRYADGTHELYDHLDDPNEWRNVVDRHPAVTKELATWIPKNEARPVEELN